MNTVEQAKCESTCQKRITVCEIYDRDGNLLSCESNRCDPVGGTCHRLGLVQDKANYDINSHCNWTHAEINAVNHLPPNSEPYRSIIYGHTFYCDNCENALRACGVKILEMAIPVFLR